MANSNQTFDMANLAVAECGGLENLLRRLHKGMIIKSRIVHALGNRRFLLRIFGYNLIMESDIKFQRFDEALIEVQETAPKLRLKMVKNSIQSGNSPAGPGQTNILA